MNISVKLHLFLNCGLRLLPFFCLALCMLHLSCASTSLPYTKTELNRSRSVTGLRFIRFSTKKGRQLAFYVPPLNSSDSLPCRLVIVFPGIVSKALERLDWAELFSEAGAGVLLIDYPGRGECEGVMRPKHLPWTTAGALSALADQLNVSPERFEGRFLVIGHSFGTAAALQFSENHRIGRIVLLSPFLSLKQAMFRRIGPLAWFVPDNLDNKAALSRILSKSQEVRITIIHGTLDGSVPVEWGRKLEAVDPDRIVFHAIPGGNHTSVLTKNIDSILDALFD